MQSIRVILAKGHWIKCQNNISVGNEHKQVNKLSNDLHEDELNFHKIFFSHSHVLGSGDASSLIRAEPF